MARKYTRARGQVKPLVETPEIASPTRVAKKKEKPLTPSEIRKLRREQQAKDEAAAALVQEEKPGLSTDDLKDKTPEESEETGPVEVEENPEKKEEDSKKDDKKEDKKAPEGNKLLQGMFSKKPTPVQPRKRRGVPPTPVE